MKHLRIALPLTFILFLVACGGETENVAPREQSPAEVPTPDLTGPLTVAGTIQNWTAGSGVTLEASDVENNVYSTTVIDAAGAFSITVQPPSNMNYFNPTKDCRGYEINTLTVTPLTARSEALFFTTRGPVRAGVRLVDSPTGASARLGQYRYADQPLTATGQLKCSSEYFSPLLTYDLNLTQGWNFVVADLSYSFSNDLQGITYTSYSAADVPN